MSEPIKDLKAWCRWKREQADFNEADQLFVKALEDLISLEGTLRAERDKYKWEYENLCKFATDFEQQRDVARESLRKLKVTLQGVCKLRNLGITHGESDPSYQNLREILWGNAYRAAGVEEVKKET